MSAVVFNRRGFRCLSVAMALALLGAAPALAQRRSVPKLNWRVGPTTGQLGDQAQVQVPTGYRFLRGQEANQFLEALGNIADDSVMGVLMPASDDWFLVFEFEDVGYVKDDEKTKLDADQMLKEMKDSDGPANEQRKKQGLSAIHTVGWQRKPAYNEQTHNLEWALRLQSGGPEFVNHRTKILGRRGVMDVTWVGDPDEMADALPKCQTLLQGFSYTSGNKYSEFRAGDKIAKYGLTALITGGAAAVALKSGLLGKLWKFIVVGVIAVGAAVKRFFRRVSGATS